MHRWVRGGRPVDGPADADLRKDIGSSLGINATLEDQDIYLRELYWSHAPAEALRYTLGWIDSSYRYDFNELANDDYLNFIASPLVNSAAIPFPDSGLALDGVLEIGAGLDLHGGLYQANCKKASFECLEDLNGSEYFLPVEVRAGRSLL